MMQIYVVVIFYTGANERNWTADPFLTMEVLYQLSYDGIKYSVT